MPSSCMGLRLCRCWLDAAYAPSHLIGDFASSLQNGLTKLEKMEKFLRNRGTPLRVKGTVRVAGRGKGNGRMRKFDLVER